LAGKLGQKVDFINEKAAKQHEKWFIETVKKAQEW
jgi:hypothetical protein